MLVVQLQFPTGRYHATPWGHHVNEALVEWPPSPWRLLRALVATWYLKASEDVSEAVLRRLLGRLGEEPPEFFLPSGQPFHTRHYVPIAGENTTKIFDGFLHVGHQAAYVTWPSLVLDAEEEHALQVLVSRLGYLGRAESWVDAQIVNRLPDQPPAPVRLARAGSDQDSEIVQVLAPLPEDAFEAWRKTWIDRRVTEALSRKGKDKLSAKERAKAIEDLPADQFEALHADTANLRRRGWSSPPGSQWVAYRRPRGLLTPRQAPPPRRAVPRCPTVARFSIASAVAPQLTDALHTAERLRRCVLKKQDETLGPGSDLPVFVGRGDSGPLRGHEHLHVLLEPSGERAKLGHVVFHAPMGFDQDARRVLSSLRTLWRRGGHHLQFVLLGFGEPADFGGLRYDEGQSAVLAESTTWVSITPFVATRHLDRSELRDPHRFAKATRAEVERLLAGRGLPRPIAVDFLEDCILKEVRLPWRRFKTRRIWGDGLKGNVPPIGIHLEFDRPVRGPVCLGYGAHFGLGLFAPADAYGARRPAAERPREPPLSPAVPTTAPSPFWSDDDDDDT